MAFNQSARNPLGTKAFVLALIVGVLLLGVGILLLSQPSANWIEVQATVTDLTVESAIDEDTSYKAELVFTDVDGVEHVLSDYSISSGIDVGDTVVLEYKEGDPSCTRSKGGEYLPYVLIGVGALLLVFGGVSLVLARNKAQSAE